MRTARHGAFLVLIFLVALAACRGADGQDKGSVSTPASSEPKKSDQVLELDYSAEIKGGIDLSFDRATQIRVLTITGSDPQLAGVYLLSVGPAAPVETGNNTWFRIAFDLVKFTGNGKYNIRAGSPQQLLEEMSPAPGKSIEPPDQSNVLVQFWTSTPQAGTTPQTFNHTLDPCPLEVSNEGLKGHLECPRVSDDKGSLISLSMRWS